MTKRKKAIIIGAGPAGLTAGVELLERTGILPFVFEASSDIGGISKTVNYKGNRMDIGGHRFFSKSERVMAWWQKMMPLEAVPDKSVQISYRGQNTGVSSVGGPDSQSADRVLLVRNRVSRIFFLKQFFDYPLTMNWKTLRQFGFFRLARIFLSYLRTSLFPVRPEKNLEDFYINRFGKELYLTFFKNYTEKVWGTSCKDMDASWGRQRVKGLNMTKAVSHAVHAIFFEKGDDISQKKIETSLIEKFLYPKYGPGQMWETAAAAIQEKGGELRLNHVIQAVHCRGFEVEAVEVKDRMTGEIKRVEGDYFFSTMPVKDLILNMKGIEVPENISKIAAGLEYRDFISVGLLVKKLKIKNETKIQTSNNLIPDNWIYIQEQGIKIGRIQIFNNWSPYLVKDADTVWLGLEYFCSKGDSLWEQSDDQLKALVVREMEEMGFIEEENVLDSVIVRMEKTYPAYCGTYKDFDAVKAYLNQFENLFLIGRNGMHRYNNSDHSMLTAMTAVDNIIGNITAKDNIWSVNTEQEYHEEKQR